MLQDRYGWSVQPRIFISLVIIALILLIVAAVIVVHQLRDLSEGRSRDNLFCRDYCGSGSRHLWLDEGGR